MIWWPGWWRSFGPATRRVSRRNDYIPLLALPRRRLSDDEAAAVARELAARGELNIDIADIGAAIMRITDELPSANDLVRVQRRLEAIGWVTGRPRG